MPSASFTLLPTSQLLFFMEETFCNLLPRLSCQKWTKIYTDFMSYIDFLSYNYTVINHQFHVFMFGTHIFMCDKKFWSLIAFGKSTADWFFLNCSFSFRPLLELLQIASPTTWSISGNHFILQVFPNASILPVETEAKAFNKNLCQA